MFRHNPTKCRHGEPAQGKSAGGFKSPACPPTPARHATHGTFCHSATCLYISVQQQLRWRRCVVMLGCCRNYRCLLMALNASICQWLPQPAGKEDRILIEIDHHFLCLVLSIQYAFAACLFGEMSSLYACRDARERPGSHIGPPNVGTLYSPTPTHIAACSLPALAVKV